MFLCKHSKKDSKDFAKKQNLNLAPSSLMFHNIQSSNVESFSKFIDDELTINKKENIRCDFGPYYLNKYENKPTIENLEKVIEDFKKENSPKGRLREWLSELEINKLIVQKDEKQKTPIFDILQILSVTDENKDTK